MLTFLIFDAYFVIYNMKTKNQKRRDFFLVLVILWIVVLAVCFIMKLCGNEIRDWELIVDILLLILCGIMYKNYAQAVKEETKFGNK